MFNLNIARPRILTAIALILILGVVAFGYAAANTVNPTGAGDAAGLVSGYTISDIAYTLSLVNPATVTSLTLVVTSKATPLIPATDVRITVNPGASATWTTCAIVGVTTTWTCTFGTAPTVASIENLQVLAVGGVTIAAP